MKKILGTASLLVLLLMGCTDGDRHYVTEALRVSDNGYFLVEEDGDVRRYAYWSVFAGCFGFTYGHNIVMQFYQQSDPEPAFGAKIFWDEAIHAPGASQMKHLKDLMLSRPFLERIPDQSIIGGSQGNRYDFLAATRGENYAFIYCYNGRDIEINMGRIRRRQGECRMV